MTAAGRTRTARGPRPCHVPQRTCIGCRTTSAKRGFVRLVRTADGRVVIDPTGKQAGRGAYLCAQPACWEQAVRRDALSRALKVTLAPPDRAALEAYAAALPRDATDEQAGTS